MYYDFEYESDLEKFDYRIEQFVNCSFVDYSVEGISTSDVDEYAEELAASLEFEEFEECGDEDPSIIFVTDVESARARAHQVIKRELGVIFDSES